MSEDLRDVENSCLTRTAGDEDEDDYDEGSTRRASRYEITRPQCG